MADTQPIHHNDHESDKGLRVDVALPINMTAIDADKFLRAMHNQLPERTDTSQEPPLALAPAPDCLRVGCDAPECDTFTSLNSTSLDQCADDAAVIKTLKEQGWETTVDGRDLCPKHRDTKQIGNSPVNTGTFSTTHTGGSYPFVEDSGGDIFFGYGHQDKAAFAKSLTDYFRKVQRDQTREPATTQDVQHRYAISTHPEHESIHWGAGPDDEVTASTPGSFPITLVFY